MQMRTHTHQTVALQAEKAEQELQQKIQRENAEIMKAANIREETMRSLTEHRVRTEEERKRLQAIKKVHSYAWRYVCVPVVS